MYRDGALRSASSGRKSTERQIREGGMGPRLLGRQQEVGYKKSVTTENKGNGLYLIQGWEGWVFGRFQRPIPRGS